MVAETVRRPGRTFRARPASWAPAGEWRLYRAWGDLPRESAWWRRLLSWLLGGWQELLYIGVTGRTAVARWAEHLQDKDWAPEVAVWERDPRIWPTKTAVEAAEQAAIRDERPVYNIAHNGNNPRAVTRRRRHLPRHMLAARIRLAFYACVWTAAFAGLWLAGWDVWRGWDGPRNSTVGATLILAAILWPKARRWWKRTTRPRRRRAVR